MTATERLRALLDERGVEWDGWLTETDHSFFFIGSETTYWGDDSFVYIEPIPSDRNTGGVHPELSVHDCTPEQAVSVTLGPGTCKDATSEDHTQAFTCSECGCWVAYDEYWETGIYVEGEGQAVHIHPHYCPNCGRKVEK